MNNEDFWKHKYKQIWDETSKKEEKIKTLIETECNCKCAFVGLGAGSTDFLNGFATKRGYQKGQSDLMIQGTNIYVEVTGTDVAHVTSEADLWIRPDKIWYAINNPEKDCWVVHVLKNLSLIRVIHLNEEFKEKFVAKNFMIIHPFVQLSKTTETYVSIPANSEHVEDIESFFRTIRNPKPEDRFDLSQFM